MANRLSRIEIQTLIELVRRVYSFVAKLRVRDRLAEKIQFPKVPKDLSESLALEIIPEVPDVCLGAELRLGGNRADILANYKGTDHRIEIKATGSKGFQHFSKKDVTADWIIWIHFNQCFANNADQIEVFCIPSPSDFNLKVGRITLHALKRIIGRKLIVHRFDIGTLKRVTQG